MTPQRQSVLRVLADLPGPSTANAIHHLLRAGGGQIGLTTVYRHLASLAEESIIGITQDGAGRHLFHLRTDSHGHYLTCVRCGLTVGVDTTPVARWAAETAASHGFTGIRMSVNLAGLCVQCRSDPLGGVTAANGPPR